MASAYALTAAAMAMMAVASSVAKVRRDPRVVRVINEVVGVPMKWLPWLAACEFAGAVGLLMGIVWPPLGLAASIGLVLYFLGAVAAHVRVGDLKGIGPASFLLVLAGACLITRVLDV
jgi:hypothetical protein